MGELLLLAGALAAAGALAGVLAGLFGIGGGAILVPILLAAFVWLGVDPSVSVHMAVGTSLAIIVPTAIRSYSAHKAKGAGDGALLRRWRFWVPLGVACAALVVPYVSGDMLRIVFASVASLVAAKMLFNRDNWSLGKVMPSVGVVNGVGFGIGAVSTFMGIGGGNLNNLFMTSFGQPIHKAVATSAGLGVLIAVPGVLGYVWAGWGNEALPDYTLGFVHLLGAAVVIPFAFLTAPLGASLAHSLPPRRLEIAFGMFLLVVVLRMVWSVLA